MAKDEAFDRQVGIGLGLGLSHDGLAELLGCSPNTVRNHLDRSGHLIMQIKAETEAIAAVSFAKKVSALEAKNDSKQSLREVKEEIRRETYEKLLAKLKGEIDDDLFVKLSRTALEFTDEKPAQTQKRISEYTENINVTINGETWDAFEGYLAEEGIIPARIAPKATDIVVLRDGSAERN